MGAVEIVGVTADDILGAVASPDLVYFILGLLGGWWFYRKSNQDLTGENRKLLRQINLILVALENAGIVKLLRKAEGEVVSVAIELSGEARGQATTTADLTVGGPAQAKGVPWWRFWGRWG